jgi:menaquinone-dependent protoporphyrinogen IX oxidase
VRVLSFALYLPLVDIAVFKKMAVIYMKLWPQKKWKQALLVFFLAVVVVLASLAIVVAYASSAVNKDVVSGISVVNPSGSKTALVVYQEGLTAYPKDTSYAFANGLAASGWRVEITTASSQAPSNLSKYSLLVLGSPTYNADPGQTIVRYVDRMGDLHGVNTAIISLGSYTPEKSADTMKQTVQAANGTVVKSLALPSSITLIGLAPSGGTGSPADIARQAGTQIRP